MLLLPDGQTGEAQGYPKKQFSSENLGEFDIKLHSLYYASES
jgi:hypothetical protein